MPSQNVEIAKKAYEAYGAGDVETAQADVAYRSGKLVKAVSIADTAMQERVFGTK